MREENDIERLDYATAVSQESESRSARDRVFRRFTIGIVVTLIVTGLGTILLLGYAVWEGRNC